MCQRLRLGAWLLLLWVMDGAAAVSAQGAAEEPTLQEYVPAEIASLDPTQCSDTYSHRAVSQVYETLLEYHYLKRPYELQPCLAAEMPATSEDGMTITIKLRPGVRYADDACFPAGKGREVAAADFAIAWKRLADSRSRSPGWWIFDQRIAGLNEYRELTTGAEWCEAQVKKSGDPLGAWLADVEGIKVVDDLTLQVRLTGPLPQFNYFLAMPYTSPIPPEALRKYGEGLATHAVGTGPYLCTSFDGNSKVTYVANPGYRECFYPGEGEAGDAEKGLLADAGKRLPLTRRIEISVIVEDLPRWLQFTSGNLDRYEPTHDVFSKIVTPAHDGLTSDYRALGMRLEVFQDLDTVYHCFNMEDPLLGKNVYLRRAMNLAYDTRENIRELRNGRAVPSHGPIPPGIFGHNPEKTSRYRMPDDMPRALELAQKLMARAGFPGGEGLPKIKYATLSGEGSRDFDEQFASCLRKIGVELDIQVMSWPEFDELIRGRRGQLWGVAWLADYADPENFLQLLYGPNSAPGANGANYVNARYDELYPQMVTTPSGPERQKIIDEMVAIVQEDCPWIFGEHRSAFIICQGWQRNYKYTAVGGNNFRFYGVDPERKRELRQRFDSK